MILLWLLTKLRYRNAYIGYLARVSNSQIENKCRIFRGARVFNCSIDYDSHVSCEAVVRDATIGKRTGIAERAIIGVYRRMNKRTYIGNDVMIGTGAIIMEGVTIGNGAWIGAGCVIRKNVKPYTVMAMSEPIKLRTRPKDEAGQKMG